ncbi:MAG TPA: glutamate--tRNA ligase [Candidatus Polarisedimenticolaceae bacterium]|nr:glutamate--tRNA ligase [Candidatus Polarisedimenticolaceae bacterium]
MSGEPEAPRVRFAPSPTGSLHLGNARTALFNWLVARQGGGVFVLRVEDTDIDRERAGSERAILEDLRWLGLDWDEGPDVDGPYGPYRQSERAQSYAAAARLLLDRGRAYRCFCDERRLEEERERRVAEGRAPHYDGRCRRIGPAESSARSEREAFAVRFLAAPADGADASERVTFVDRLRGGVEFPLAEIGDTVIVRRDGRPTYNFAVVVDDIQMKIDLVLRGDDHLSNTPRQVLIFEALGHPPPEFVHLPMVRGPDGTRLSKRHGAVSVGEYRRAGYPVDGMINGLALLGWSPGDDRVVIDRSELVEQFRLDRIVRSPATFDPQKLEWICAQHIQRMDESALLEPLRERLAEAGRLPADWSPALRAWAPALVPIVRTFISRFDQIPERCAPVFHPGGRPPAADAETALVQPVAVEVVRALCELASVRPPIDLEAWHALRDGVRERAGVRGKALFRPLRVALSGSESGPELDLLVPLIETGHAAAPDRIDAVATRARRTLEWLGAA